MRLSELKNAGRTPALPMSIALEDAAGPAELQLLSLLRVLPGQRYVGAGIWRGRTVLAKLLVGSKAPRHFQRERDGVQALAKQGFQPHCCWLTVCRKVRAAGCCSNFWIKPRAWAMPGNP